MDANPKFRTMRLIDVENLAGGPLTDVAAIQALIEQVIPKGPGDQEVVAVSGDDNAIATFFVWNGPARFLLRRGHDGADLALLGELRDVAFLRARFERVVIASGDHAFAPAIAALMSAGMEVIVIGPTRGTAKSVRAARPSAMKYLNPPVGHAAVPHRPLAA